MSRWIRASFAVIALGLVTSFITTANADDDKVMSVEDIMKKVHGKKGSVAKTTAAVKENKWDDAAKLSKLADKAAVDIAKGKPQKGDMESWAKQTKTYAANVKAMSAAIEKKDKEAYEKAEKVFSDGKSCKACHSEHKN